jgi:hypothetical protein
VSPGRPAYPARLIADPASRVPSVLPVNGMLSLNCMLLVNAVLPISGVLPVNGVLPISGVLSVNGVPSVLAVRRVPPMFCAQAAFCVEPVSCAQAAFCVEPVSCVQPVFRAQPVGLRPTVLPVGPAHPIRPVGTIGVERWLRRHVLAGRPGYRLLLGQRRSEPGHEVTPCRVLVALSALRVIPVRHVSTAAYRSLPSTIAAPGPVLGG